MVVPGRGAVKIALSQEARAVTGRKKYGFAGRLGNRTEGRTKMGLVQHTVMELLSGGGYEGKSLAMIGKLDIDVDFNLWKQ